MLLIALQSRLEFTHTMPFMKIVIVLGQTALFFYVLHIRLIELVSPMVAPLPLPSLVRSLLIVLAVLPVMVLLCRLYRQYKRQHPASVLQYL